MLYQRILSGVDVHLFNCALTTLSSVNATNHFCLFPLPFWLCFRVPLGSSLGRAGYAAGNLLFLPADIDTDGITNGVVVDSG